MPNNNGVTWSCICCGHLNSKQSYAGPFCEECERKTRILLAQGISPENIVFGEQRPARRDALLNSIKTVEFRIGQEKMAAQCN